MLMIGQLLVVGMLLFAGGLSVVGLSTLLRASLLALLVSVFSALLVWLAERVLRASLSPHRTALHYSVLGAAITVAIMLIELSLYFAFTAFFHIWGLFEAVVLAVLLSVVLLRYLYLERQARLFQSIAEKAQVQELQARIRPHFLYNSMNMVASLIGSDPQKAEQVVVDLSELFRRVLDDAQTLVPLREELALCRTYLALEKLRLGERLQTEWTIGDYGDAMIPSLTLQPVVENAVYHGIQLLPEGGVIKIAVKRINNRLILTVGNPRSQRMQHNKGSKMAIDNVQRRLIAHFGPTAVVRAERMDNHYITHINYPAGE